MTDKEQINNFAKDINVPRKEQIIISNRRQGKNIYTIKEDVAELEINSKKYGKLLFIIDASLLDIITKHYWGARCYRGHFYAYTHLGGYKYISLHRLITQCPNNLMVDHINHDTFDNRSKNLKICTNKENQHNRKNFEGVKVTKWGYQVQMRVKGKLKCFGTYKTLSEAKQVRISAEKEYRPYVKEINKYGT